MKGCQIKTENIMESKCFCLLFFRPTYSVLGNVPGTELYVDMETHREVGQMAADSLVKPFVLRWHKEQIVFPLIGQARQIPGVTIFRSSATVYFANAELYLEALKEKVCSSSSWLSQLQMDRFKLKIKKWFI